MAYAILAGANGHTVAQSSGGAATTTGAIDTTGADLIVVGYGSAAGGYTVADSKSNTWSALTTQTDGATISTRISYCQAPTVGSGHTFTVGAGGWFGTVFVACFSGSAASPFDAETGADSGGSGSTTKAPGSITPAAAGELFIVTTGTNGGAPAYSIDLGFTITDSAGLVGGNSYGGAMAYLINSGSTAQNPTYTQAAANYIPVRMATFKAAAGGGATNWGPWIVGNNWNRIVQGV